MCKQSNINHRVTLTRHLTVKLQHLWYNHRSVDWIYMWFRWLLVCINNVYLKHRKLNAWIPFCTTCIIRRRRYEYIQYLIGTEIQYYYLYVANLFDHKGMIALLKIYSSRKFSFYSMNVSTSQGLLVFCDLKLSISISNCKQIVLKLLL